MQVRRADRFRKRFTESVEKIEDQRLLDLNFFLRALELADPLALLPPTQSPARKRCDEQAEENSWPHAPRGESVRRRLVVEVLLQIIEDVFEPRKILRRRLTERLMRIEHIDVDLFLLLSRHAVGLVALEKLAFRRGRPVAVNIENLIEPETGQ